MLEKLKKSTEKYMVELSVGIYLFYILYTTVAPNIYSYVSVWYVLDYTYGFGSRLMMGSLLHLFTGDFISVEQAYGFVVVMLAVLCALLALFSGMVYRRISEKQGKWAILFLIVLYLASPASPAYLWTAENMGRLDTYLFANAVILAIIACKIKNYKLKYILYLLIGVFTVSIHQVYFFLFFPSLLIILIQDIFAENIGKNQKFYAFGIAFVIGVTFLYMQFRSGIYYDNLEMLYEKLCRHTDIPLIPEPLEAEYFWTIKDHFTKNMLPELRERIRFGIITVVLLCPIWIIYLYLWIGAIKHSAKKNEKGKYWLMLLTNTAYIPVFALMTDWGRWFAAFFIVQFINILVLAYQGDRGIRDALQKLGNRIDKNPVVFLMVVLYISGFEKFEGINVLQQVQDFYYTTYNVWVNL